MKRIHIYLRDGQLDYLRKTNVIPISEHIRKAIDEYINKLTSYTHSSSESVLVKKGGKNVI